MVWPLVGLVVSALASSNASANADKPQASANNAAVGKGDKLFTEEIQKLTARIKDGDKSAIPELDEKIKAKKAQEESQTAQAPPAKQDSGGGGGNIIGGLINGVLGMFTGGGAKA